MGEEVVRRRYDDRSGEPATDTIRFALEGTTYEIDLCAENAAALRTDIGEWTQYARKVSNRVTKGRGPRIDRMTAAETKAIRTWAIAQGIQLAERGRLPGHVVDAYRTRNREKTAA